MLNEVPNALLCYPRKKNNVRNFEVHVMCSWFFQDLDQMTWKS